MVLFLGCVDGHGRWRLLFSDGRNSFGCGWLIGGLPLGRRGVEMMLGFQPRAKKQRNGVFWRDAKSLVRKPQFVVALQLRPRTRFCWFSFLQPQVFPFSTILRHSVLRSSSSSLAE